MTFIATHIGAPAHDGASILIAAAGSAAGRCRALAPSLGALLPGLALDWRSAAQPLPRGADCELLVLSTGDQSGALQAAETALARTPACPVRMVFVTDAARAAPTEDFLAACDALLEAGGIILVPAPGDGLASDDAVSHAILALVAALHGPGLVGFDHADLVSLFGNGRRAVGHVLAQPASAQGIPAMGIEHPDLHRRPDDRVAAFAHLMCWREADALTLNLLERPLGLLAAGLEADDDLKYQCSIAAAARPPQGTTAPWVFTRLIARRVSLFEPPREALRTVLPALALGT